MSIQSLSLTVTNGARFSGLATKLLGATKMILGFTEVDIMKFFFLFFILASCSGVAMKYKYASSDARIHCSKGCPGADCLCIMGPDDTWYLSPETGDEQ